MGPREAWEGDKAGLVSGFLGTQGAWSFWRYIPTRYLRYLTQGGVAWGGGAWAWGLGGLVLGRIWQLMDTGQFGSLRSVWQLSSSV